MENWGKAGKITYRRWTNPDLSDEPNFMGRSDEDQGTDMEICTIASPKLDSERRKSSAASGSDKPAGTFTVDDALEAAGFGWFQWKICLLTGLSWTGDAMEMMILSILGPEMHCDWRLSSFKVALITSVVFIGTGIGSTVWGHFSDKYGRKVGLIFCTSWTLYFGFLSVFAPIYGWLLVLRGLVGCGLGGAPQAVTMYSEFLPVKSRGLCIMMIAAFWALGAVFEVLLALLVMPTLGWRWLLGLSAIPLMIFLCLSFWLPESPRFDVLTGNREKAMATLTSIAKANGKTLPQGTLVSFQQNDRGQLKDLFAPNYWRTTVLLWLIWFSYAFSYYGIVLLTTELFQAGYACGSSQGAKIEPSCSLECKYLTSADYKDLLWTTLAEFPGLFAILFLVDRLGRKKSSALCFFMFSLFVLPLYACIGRIALTIFIFVARAFISGGYQVAFVYTPEVYPTEIRALAMGTCGALAKLGALLTPFVAQVILRKSVYATLSIYCCVSLIAGIASLLLPIETLGRNLIESRTDRDSGHNNAATTISSNDLQHR